MKSQQLTSRDLLFGLQIVTSLSFGTHQFITMLSSTEGMSLTLFSSSAIFMAINTMLGYEAWRKERNRDTLQTLIIYVNWVILMSANTALMIWKKVPWTLHDTYITTLVSAGVIATFSVSFCKKLALGHPIIRGWLGLFFKSMPQFYLAYCIVAAKSGAGLSPIAVVCANIGIGIRVFLAWQGVMRKGGDQHHQRALLLSELGNWLSWMTVTSAWARYQLIFHA